MRKLTILAWLACLGILVGCAGDPHPGPRSSDTDDPRNITTSSAMWEPDLTTDEGDASFIVTEVVDIRDTLKNAKHDARLAAMKKGVKRVVEDVLNNYELFMENEQKINDKIINQPQKFLLRAPVEVDTMTRGNQYAIKLQMKVNKDKVAKALQDLRIIRQGRQSKPILVVVYKNKRFVDDHLRKDLSIELAKVFNNRGLRAVLFEDLKADIIERRTLGERGTDFLLTKFQDDPEFANTGDEVEGGLIILRNYGRVMMGFNIIKVARSGNRVEAGVEAHCRDLLTRRVIASDKKYSSAVISGDYDLAKSQLIFNISKELAGSLVNQVHRFLDKLEEGTELTGRTLTFIFRKFRDDDQAQIARVLQQAVGGQVELVDADEGYLEFEGNWSSEESGISTSRLADRILRNLKKNGLRAKIPGGVVSDRASKIRFERD